MNERLNPFLDIKDAPVFAVKPKTDKPSEEKAIAKIAEDNNFQSRQPKKQPKIEKRKPRVYRTGRNIQFNSKVTQETFNRIYKAADDTGETLGKILELAMDAFEREAGSKVK